MARLSIKLRCQYRRTEHWVGGHMRHVGIGLLHQNVLNLPKMTQITTMWDENWTVIPKCSKSHKNNANFYRVE